MRPWLVVCGGRVGAEVTEIAAERLDSVLVERSFVHEWRGAPGACAGGQAEESAVVSASNGERN